MPKILIVSATRLSEDEFYSTSALGQTLSITYAKLNLRRQIYFNNKNGLSECYNDAIENVAADDDIIVFVHDDVFITDFFWIDKLLWGVGQFSILGVAGNRRRVPGQPAWAFLNTQGVWDTPQNLSGLIGYGQGFPCGLSFYGPPGVACKLIDGVFMAATRATFQQYKLRFDPQFTFHFYDMDLCRQAEALNIPVGTVPLGLVHQSGGDFRSPAWQDAHNRYFAKWGD